MDPNNLDSFNHRTKRLSTARNYHFVDQIPESYDPKLTSTLLCIHGFPDQWYGWRYQIGPWTRAGYRVVVPDMLGYGGSDKPKEPSEYSTKKLCADLAALLDFLGVSRAVLVGHDWGSFTAGRFALWYPKRTQALVMMSVPYTPPSPKYIPIEEVAKRAPNYGYQVYFANPAATSEIEDHLEKFLSLLFRAPNSGEGFTHSRSLSDFLPRSDSNPPSVLNDRTFQRYLKDFKEGGMNGPLNYYRTTRYRHEEEEAAKLPTNLSPELPVLFIWGSEDPTVIPAMFIKSKKFMNTFQTIALAGKGHWVMVEAKDEVAEKVAGWLQGVFSRPSRGVKL